MVDQERIPHAPKTIPKILEGGQSDPNYDLADYVSLTEREHHPEGIHLREFRRDPFTTSRLRFYQLKLQEEGNRYFPKAHFRLKLEEYEEFFPPETAPQFFETGAIQDSSMRYLIEDQLGLLARYLDLPTVTDRLGDDPQKIRRHVRVMVGEQAYDQAYQRAVEEILGSKAESELSPEEELKAKKAAKKEREYVFAAYSSKRNLNGMQLGFQAALTLSQSFSLYFELFPPTTTELTKAITAFNKLLARIPGELEHYTQLRPSQRRIRVLQFIKIVPKLLLAAQNIFKCAGVEARISSPEA